MYLLFFCCLCFWCQNWDFAKPKVIRFTPMFSSKTFIVLTPTLRSLFHLQYFLCLIEVGIQIYSFAYRYAVARAPFVENIILSPLNCLGTPLAFLVWRNDYLPFSRRDGASPERGAQPASSLCRCKWRLTAQESGTSHSSANIVEVFPLPPLIILFFLCLLMYVACAFITTRSGTKWQGSVPCLLVEREFWKNIVCILQGDSCCWGNSLHLRQIWV